MNATPTDTTLDGATPLLMVDAQGLDVLSPDECRDFLARETTGRVGLVANGQPLIFPVNYAFVADSIIYRTAPGSKLDAARRFDRVVFEIDDWSEETRTGWSVLAKGTARPVEDEWHIALCEYFDIEPWADQIPREHWVRIDITELTGRLIFREGTLRAGNASHHQPGGGRS